MNFTEKLKNAKLRVPQDSDHDQWGHKMLEEFATVLSEKHRGEFFAKFRSSGPTGASVSVGPWERPNEEHWVLVILCDHPVYSVTYKGSCMTKEGLEAAILDMYTSTKFGDMIEQVTLTDRSPIDGFFRFQEKPRDRSSKRDVYVHIEHDSMRKAADAYWSGTKEIIEINFKRTKGSPIAQGDDLTGTTWLILEGGICVKVESIFDSTVKGRVVKDAW